MRRIGMLFGIGLLVAQVALAAPAGAAQRKCQGKRATIVGTNASERLIGTPGPDVIVGLGGNDIILGRTGADVICAGTGSDFVRAGGGNDKVFGHIGADTVAGDNGNDVVEGGAGSDLVYGGEGADTLRSGPGASAVLYGNRGNDRLIGSDGFDTLLGLQGDDAIDGAGGNFDVASFLFADNPDGVVATIAGGTATGEGEDTLVNVESLQGSLQADELTGGETFNVFYPMDGDDSVFGGGGDDLVSFTFSSRRVVVDLFLGQATGEGADMLVSVASVQGSDFPDTIAGNIGENSLFGELGDDQLSGSLADDLLDGGDGNDTGDGGLQGVEGDRCISIENPTDCEITEGSAASRASMAVGFRPAVLVPFPRG